MGEIIFKRVESKTTGFKAFGGLVVKFDECKDIITEQVQLGYEYKGFVPVEQLGQGYITKIDLIFEKKDK